MRRAGVDVAPGLLLAVALGIVATFIGRAVPLVGGPVSGIVIGVIIRMLIGPQSSLMPGIRFAGRFVLQLSVVILGSQLSLAEAARVGLQSLPVLLGTLLACLLAAWLVGRALGVVGDLRTLIGVGTGVCGASAIAAVTPVIGAVGADVAYAVSTIFLFNIAAVIAFPIVGHALGLSQHAFGLLAGTAVNDTSSVIAAATTYGQEATRYAVVVKLVRTLTIIPISIGLSLAKRRSAGAGETLESDPKRRFNVVRLVPWFLIGFVVVAGVNSSGLIPQDAHSGLAATSTFMITVALSAIGFSTDVGSFRRSGPRPLILGAVLWVVVSLTSLGLQALFGIL